MGRYVASDPNNFGGWRTYMRLRITMDIRKPLKRRMKIKKAGGEWVWLNFKYEQLPTFCFFCGIIGHSEKLCEKLFDNLMRKEDMSCGLGHIRKGLSTWWGEMAPINPSDEGGYGQQR